ncbi:MAG: type IVB secretion system protein IcmH/DotU [Rhizobiaceae bacterium]|nr:type IVB secretion system protein IcmH/DotU [Rhizobiaceae bacterium]
MSSKDDPFGDGKTVIGRVRQAGRGAAPVPRAPTPRAEATVFDPGFAERHVAGWSETPPAASRFDRQVLEEAGSGIATRSANPLIAAAAPLLILLGQFSRSPPDVEPQALADRLAELVDDFELAVTRSDVHEGDGRVARYVLCETIDDMVQALPGIGPATWMPMGMLARFFRTDAAGAGFFDALNRALGNPEPHCDVIELMYACLSLGFEGQYRGMEDGPARLDAVRRDTYQVLRYFRPAPMRDLSAEWQPVVPGGRRSRRAIPVWVFAAAGCALVAGAFVEVRGRIARQGEAVAAEILSLTPATPVAIEHAAFVPVLRAAPPPPPPAEPPPPADVQLERLRAALARQIEDGSLTVAAKGAFIVVEIGNQQLFQPGKAILKPEFEGLAEPLAAALGTERGPVRIVGHTDSDKPGRTSIFKSNYDLSVARAQAVQKRLAQAIGGKVALEVEGKGEDEPVADNATPEGKARNRRVDLLIARGQGA